MKHIVAITLSFLFLSGTSLHSDCYDNDYCCVDPCCEQGYSRLYIGPQLYGGYLKVQNTDSTAAGLIGLDNFDSSEKGFFYGANGGYEYKHPWGLFANIDLNYGQGDLKKSGDLSRYLHEYEVTGVVGYQLGGCVEDRWSATGYIGVDYLTQNFHVSDLDVGYRYYLYRIPVGIKGDYSFCACSSRWSVGINVAVLPQFDSTVKISVLNGARWSLAKRTDWMVAIPLEYSSCMWPVSVKLNLFWRKVGIGGSKAKTSSGNALGLPPSKWNAFGAALDIAWEF